MLGVLLLLCTAALTCLLKQYTELAHQLLEEVISRLCSTAAAAAAGGGGGGNSTGSTAADCKQESEQLLLWLRLLLPSPAAAGSGATASAAAGSDAKTPNTPGKSSKKGPGAKRTFGLTPAADAKLQQQQLALQQQEQQSLGPTPLQDKVMQGLDPQLLKRLLVSVAQALSTAAAAAGAETAAAAAAAAASGVDAAAVAAASVLQCLQGAQQLLLSAVALCSKSRGRGADKLRQLCQLSVPQPGSLAQQQQQQQEVDPSSEGWLQQQQALFAAAMQQHQHHRRKRPRAEADAAPIATDPAATTSLAGAAADGGDVGAGSSGSSGNSNSSKRWRRAESWRPCAVGCLPGARRPELLLDILAAPSGLDDSLAAGTGVTAAATVAAVVAAAAVGAGAVGGLHAAGAPLGLAEYGATAVEAGAGTGVAKADYVPEGVVLVADAADADHSLTGDDGVSAAAAAAAAAADGTTSCSGVEQCQVMGGAQTETAVRLGHWWELKREELPQLQQAVQLLL